MTFVMMDGVRVDLTPDQEAAFEASRVAVPTEADIVAARDRRLAAGFDYVFPDARGTHRIGTTPQDLAGWSEVTTLAGAMIAAGNPAGTIGIVTNTGAVSVTATEWQSVLLAAAAFRQPIWAASFALEAMKPIPADYADDKYWSRNPA